MPLRLTSSAFVNGAPMPERCTCEGGDISPGLTWDNVPSDTRGFALVCSDPDAPDGTWYHWAIFNLPIEAAGLPEGMPKSASIQMGAGSMVQGTNDFGNPGYGGPCPPVGHGRHRYQFVLTALDVPSLPVAGGGDCRDVEKAAAEHAVAVATLTGTFER